MKAFQSLLLVASLLFFLSCSKKEDASPNNSTCLKDKLVATSTQVNDAPSQTTVVLDFDVRNTGTTNYDVQKGSKPIYFKFTVTCTDNSTYQTEQIMTATTLAAGATAAASQYATYGAGKTYRSFSYELICK